MDPHNSNRFRNRKPLSSTERFLGVPFHAPPLQNPSFFTADDDLIEDDVVFFNDDSSEPSSSSSPTHNHHHSNSHHHKGSAFGPPDAFGILAALPENDPSSNNRNGSHLFHNHKASVSVSASVSSSSSSSSSRLIPSIPKPPPDRLPFPSVMFHQSAPVNVPMMSPAMARRHREFDDDVDVTDDEEMLPPHEIVARNSAQSPMLAYSVLEGVGRTLKGRDLRQVRNAVWRQTGFYG